MDKKRAEQYLAHTALVLLAILIWLFSFPSFAFAQRWKYALLVEPQSYPLRWGEKEPPEADMVPTPPRLGYLQNNPDYPRLLQGQHEQFLPGVWGRGCGTEWGFDRHHLG